VSGSSSLKSLAWRMAAGATSSTTAAMPRVSPVPTSTTALPRVVSHRRCTALTTGDRATPTSTPTPMPVMTSDAADPMANNATAARAVTANAT
jgi:hypothetical protein